MVLDGGTEQQVVVVTGGATGIGAAVAEQWARTGAFVVTMDPAVSLDGMSQAGASAVQATVEHIRAAGGSARASNVSVTDRAAIAHLFTSLFQEFGRLDAVVNVAGIIRPTEFSVGTEEDWASLLSVHVDGYLNVLRAALPLMAAQGHGRILGVTSGAGWRPANTGAYACAKRAVAALTWQFAAVTPPGVTVNAFSPIASTRMTQGVPPAPAVQRKEGASSTGGLSLAALPPPEHLGPIGAYLASDRFAWSNGQVIFSNGAEVAVIERPRFLEMVRSKEVASLAHVLSEALPATFLPAQAAQTTLGASNPRLGRVFDAPQQAHPTAAPAGKCLLVSQDAAWADVLTDALRSRGHRCFLIGAEGKAEVLAREAETSFAGAFSQLSAAIHAEGPFEAVIVALRGSSVSANSQGPDGAAWQRFLSEHEDLTQHIREGAAWCQAVAQASASNRTPIRMILLADASYAGGWTHAQAMSQLSRAAHVATDERVDLCVIGVESSDVEDHLAAGELVAHLVCGPDTAALSGADLVVGPGWMGLRSHPGPRGSILYGGPALPPWLDEALRKVSMA